MALATTYQVSPPEQFKFGHPEEWPKWSRRFERFWKASGLDAKEEEAQINTLVYSMGDEADNILRSFRLSDADSKRYNTVRGKLNSHFVKRRNVIYERARFNQRRQEAGESVDTFITALYSLAEHCGYSKLHDEMIRDRIVVGLRDAKLSEKLQLDPELTLEKAVTQVRQTESIKKQQPLVRNHNPETHLGVVNQKGRRSLSKNNRQVSNDQPDKKRERPRQNTSTSCGWCGKSPKHRKQQCPAKDVSCHKCGKRGHFQSVCRSVNELHTKADAESARNESFLGVVTHNKKGNPWSIVISINRKPIEFEIDTGAEVSVISKVAHRKIGSPILDTSGKVLCGPRNHTLSVKGQFTAKLRSGNQESEQELYVVDGLHKNLLGRPAIEALNIVNCIRTIERNNSTNETIRSNETIRLNETIQPNDF